MCKLWRPEKQKQIINVEALIRNVLDAYRDVGLLSSEYVLHLCYCWVHVRSQRNADVCQSFFYVLLQAKYVSKAFSYKISNKKYLLLLNIIGNRLHRRSF
jgi:hypothetical protein